MSNSPKSSAKQSQLNSKKPIKPSRIIFLHTPDNLLNIFTSKLGQSNIIQIKYGGPVLNLSWDHGFLDNMVHEEVGCLYDEINLVRIIKNTFAIDYDDWSKTFVTFETINYVASQYLFYFVVKSKRVSWLLPFVMRCHFCCWDCEIPLFSLQDSKNESAWVVVAVWDCDVVLFAIFSESV